MVVAGETGVGGWGYHMITPTNEIQERCNRKGTTTIKWNWQQWLKDSETSQKEKASTYTQIQNMWKMESKIGSRIGNECWKQPKTLVKNQSIDCTGWSSKEIHTHRPWVPGHSNVHGTKELTRWQTKQWMIWRLGLFKEVSKLWLSY